uniref:Uncharacterized protein n=1 Tax=Anguilla anguilla TaxID=7936 RepID=A0A0E9XLV1_ANGAN
MFCHSIAFDISSVLLFTLTFFFTHPGLALQNLSSGNASLVA